MCSVSEDNEDYCRVVKQRSTTSAADGFCVKCKASTDVISIKLDEKFCSQCLLVRLMHKFRSEFGKAHIVRGKEPVLVAYSGGQCSSALLHLVVQGLSKKTQKKLRFIPTIIHIDEDVLSLPSARSAKISAVAQNMHSTGLPYFIYTLTQMQQCEAVLVNERNDPQFDLETALANINWDAISMRSSVEAINSCMSKESLIHFWKIQTLMQVARTRGFGKVIVGDTASNLAARVLSYVAQGRGAQLASEVDFADARYGDVTIVRPMREFSEKEVDAYCALNRIEPVLPTCLLKTVADSNSVESLSRRFVGTLQLEHDHTVPIIFRTAEKLIVPQDSLRSASRGHCVMCGAALDDYVSASGVGDAQNLDVHSASPFQSNDHSAQHVTGNAATTLPVAVASHCCNRIMQEDFLQSCCYGCSRIAQEMNDSSHLEHIFGFRNRTDRLNEVLRDCVIDQESTT